MLIADDFLNSNNFKMPLKCFFFRRRYSKLVKEVVINRFYLKLQLLPATRVRILASSSFSKTATAHKTRYFSDINISQGSVATLWSEAGCLMIALLQISWRLWQWKNFDNRPVFDRVMRIILLLYNLFSRTRCIKRIIPTETDVHRALCPEFQSNPLDEIHACKESVLNSVI